MCLLIALTRVQPDFPLVVGANRDELYERPAVAMTALHASEPRIIGGRDEQAGGTWLAVNDTGVFAGITNRPTVGGRDPAKRSRGELPLAATAHTSALAAVDELTASVDPTDYNPAWMLVGDRQSLFAVDLSGPQLEIRALPPGVHVLENRSPGSHSPKIRRVEQLLGELGGVPMPEIERRLEDALSDHEVPTERARPADEVVRPPQLDAACVHTERYGTRWSAIVAVPASDGQLPLLRYSEGAPCRSAYRDATAFWRSA